MTPIGKASYWGNSGILGAKGGGVIPTLNAKPSAEYAMFGMSMPDVQRHPRLSVRLSKPPKAYTLALDPKP